VYNVHVKFLATNIRNEREKEDNGRENRKRKVISHIRRALGYRVELHFVYEHGKHIVYGGLPVVEPQLFQEQNKEAVRAAGFYIFIVQPHRQNMAPLCPESLSG